jgi:hypothetical protein
MEVWTGGPLILSFGTAADRDWVHSTGVFAVGNASRYLEKEAGGGGQSHSGRFGEGEALSTRSGIEMKDAGRPVVQ